MPKEQLVATAPSKPRVLVLLASFNGGQWIRAQLESILAQKDVSVMVAIADDGSTDMTFQELEHFSNDARVTLTHRNNPTGSAAQNFLSLIRQFSSDGFDYVAFSDQDDVWDTEKLARACRHLSHEKASGYSSAVIATWPGARTAILKQSPTQTASDFLFEGAGQGCTFLLSATYYTKVRHFANTHQSCTRPLHFHDWMIYALARCWNERWIFDSWPSVLYRQHATNDTGARGTLDAAKKRLSLIQTGWYKNQLLAMAEVCATASPKHPTVTCWRSLIHERRAWKTRLRIATFCIRGGRRRKRDNAIILLSALLGWI